MFNQMNNYVFLQLKTMLNTSNHLLKGVYNINKMHQLFNVRKMEERMEI